jgi:hypothetical protein
MGCKLLRWTLKCIPATIPILRDNEATQEIPKRGKAK